jgi:hypothetical protein
VPSFEILNAGRRSAHSSFNPTRASSSATNAHRIPSDPSQCVQEPDWTIDHPHVVLPGGWQMRIARAAGGVGEGRVGSGRSGVHGVKAKSPLLIGFPRERGPQRTQLIPLAPRGSSSDRQQPVGCLDPHRMHTHMRGRWVMCPPCLPPQDNHRTARVATFPDFSRYGTRGYVACIPSRWIPAGIEPGEVRLASSHSLVRVMTRCSPCSDGAFV